MNVIELNKIGITSEKICIVCVESLGLVIGKVTVVDDLVKITKIKVIQVGQTSEGGIQMRLPDVLGLPEEFYLIRSPLFMYEPKDPKLLDAYNKATSIIEVVPAHGLKLVPPNPTK